MRGVVSSLVLLIALFAPAAKGQDCAYVANSDSDSISIINTSRNEVAATIEDVRFTPAGLAISRDSSFLFVTNHSDDTVTVINTLTNSLAAAIRVGFQPRRIAISPNAATAYVTNSADDTISLVDTATFRELLVINSFEGAEPTGIAITPDGSRAYIANRSSSTVSILDTTSRTIVGQIPVGQGPNDVAIAPGGNVAYVVNTDSASVSAIDTRNQQVRATLAVDEAPNAVAFSSNGARAYITHGVDGRFTVINVNRDQVEAAYSIADSDLLAGLAVRGDGLVYVTDYSFDRVHLLDPGSGEVRASIDVELSPVGISLASPQGGCPAPPGPTPTPTVMPLQPCVGDCDGDRSIKVDELVRGISIALGTAQLATCPAFDTDHDEKVTVDELTRSVSAALNGCPQGPLLYVRQSTGGDGNDGSSPTTALRTLQAAIDRASPGAQIVVGPGHYDAGSADAVVNVDARHGSPGFPIEIVGDIAGMRTGDPPGTVEVDAAGRPFALRFTNSSGFVLDSLTITGSVGVNAAGIHIRTDSRDISIRNCEIAGNVGDGVRIESSSGVLLFNNLIHANQARGIQIGGGTVDTRIINNTVAQNANDGISGSGGGSRNLFMRNNIVYQNQSRGIDIRDSAAQSGYNADYNLVFQRSGLSLAYGPETIPGPNDINLDPLFISGFRLSQTSSGQRVGSPGVDSGDPFTSRELRESLEARTTKTNQDPDTGLIDMGYHYPGRFGPPPSRTLPVGTTPPGLATPTPPPSLQIYVRAATGSDANTGRSPDAALATIQAAVNRATAGNEIIVGPGTYFGTVRFRAGGDQAARITLRANPPGDRTGDEPGDVLIDAQGNGSGIFVDVAPFIIIDGFRITNSSAPAVQIRSGATGTEVRNCELFNNAEDGVRIQDSDDVVVFNNLIYCNARRGVLVGGAIGSNRNQLINNTIAQNGDRGVFVGNSDAASKNTVLRNNIIQNNRVAEIQVVTEAANSLEGFSTDYNLVFDEVAGAGQYVGASPGPNDILEPAGFVNVATCDPLGLHAADYRLAQARAGQSPESPGVDAGDPSTPSQFDIPLQFRTTATTNVVDASPLDIGFHFPP